MYLVQRPFLLASIINGDTCRMELRQLRCFVAVADEQSFTRAAGRLHVVQSAVSAAIKALEADLGAVLLERTSKRLQLTDAGAALLPQARATLGAAQAAYDAVHEVRGGLRGTLRIGTMISIGLVDVPALLGRFHEEHPAVTLQVKAAPSGSAGLARALFDGSLDVAFVSLPGPAPAALTVRDLLSAPLVLVVRSDHRLAGETQVALEQLADESFVDFPLGYGNRVLTDRAFLQAATSRQVTLEAVDIATGAEFVRAGLGVALLPDFAVPGDPQLRAIDVPGSDLLWTLSVATSNRRPLTAAARYLLEMVDEFVTSPAGAPPIR
jgi:DNA-binding transcriptional LysR family regulator